MKVYSSTQLGETMKIQVFSALFAVAFLSQPVGAVVSNASIPIHPANEATSLVERSISNPRANPPVSGSTVRVGFNPTANSGTIGNTSDTVNSLPAKAGADHDTMVMLLTGLGVMGSIARRRRLAKKTD